MGYTISVLVPKVHERIILDVLNKDAQPFRVLHGTKVRTPKIHKRTKEQPWGEIVEGVWDISTLKVLESDVYKGKFYWKSNKDLSYVPSKIKKGYCVVGIDYTGLETPYREFAQSVLNALAIKYAAKFTYYDHEKIPRGEEVTSAEGVILFKGAPAYTNYTEEAEQAIAVGVSLIVSQLP